MMPSSFMVRAKDRDGNPVMMVINPDSVAAVTFQGGANRSTTGQGSANQQPGESSQSNQPPGSTPRAGTDDGLAILLIDSGVRNVIGAAAILAAARERSTSERGKS
jgi:hypothetical protein